MLLRKKTLDGIVAGDIDLVFRRWKRPTVKTGSTLRTRAGLVQIEAVERVEVDEITPQDARRAGLDLEELVAFLKTKPEGDIYRVTLGGVVEDPRVALRERAYLTDEEIDELVTSLGRLDRASRRGPWTRQYLELVRDNPYVRAQDLADRLGLEKRVFKDNVRKLKALGLTISHSPGYELSPRGRALLGHLDGTACR